MHLVHTFVLDLKDPLVFHAPVIGGHKAFASHVPYLLFIHVSKLLLNSFPPLLARVLVGMVESCGEVLGSSGTGLV